MHYNCWILFLTNSINLEISLSLDAILDKYDLKVSNQIKNNFIKNFSSLVSKQTYSIYLMHIIFIYLLDKTEFSLLIAYVIYLPSLFVVSLLIFNYIEKPLLSLRPKMK